MIWIIISIFCVIAIVASQLVVGNKKVNIVPFVALLVWILTTAWYSVNTVAAGHVGIIYRFSDIVGQTGAGLQIIAPWNTMYEANTRLDTHVIKKADMFSKENQEVFVQITVNLEVSPEHVMDLYRRIGPEYYTKVVLPSVITFAKEETVKYPSTEVAANREKIRHDVSRRLTAELAPYSIVVKNVFLDNIDFTQTFKSAIEEKQRAVQLALAEEQRVIGVRHQAQQARERAEGEGDSKLILAKKEAEANIIVAQSVTPSLIQYMSVQKLNPNVNVMMVPPSQGLLMQVDPNKK